MNKIEKFLKKLNSKQQGIAEATIERLVRGYLVGLNIKKLKNRPGFRVRIGSIRIIYDVREDGGVIILDIDWRNESTYK